MYKERAYDSFVNMMSDIEYRVIKGLLTAKPQESIDAVELESALREDYLETGSEAVGLANVPENSENGEISISSVETPEINVIRLSDDKK